MSNEPTLEDKALAVAALVNGIQAWNSPDRRYKEKPWRAVRIRGDILDYLSDWEETQIAALAVAARILGLKPDKQITALDAFRQRMGLNYL